MSAGSASMTSSGDAVYSGSMNLDSVDRYLTLSFASLAASVSAVSTAFHRRSSANAPVRAPSVGVGPDLPTSALMTDTTMRQSRAFICSTTLVSFCMRPRQKAMMPRGPAVCGTASASAGNVPARSRSPTRPSMVSHQPSSRPSKWRTRSGDTRVGRAMAASRSYAPPSGRASATPPSRLSSASPTSPVNAASAPLNAPAAPPSALPHSLSSRRDSAGPYTSARAASRPCSRSGVTSPTSRSGPAAASMSTVLPAAALRRKKSALARSLSSPPSVANSTGGPPPACTSPSALCTSRGW